MTEACCPRPNAPPVLAPHGYPVEADGSVEARSVDGQQIFSYWVASSSNYTLLDKPSKNCRTCEISAIREFCCVDFNAFSPASSFASQSNKSRVAIKRLVFHQKCYNRSLLASLAYWPFCPKDAPNLSNTEQLSAPPEAAHRKRPLDKRCRSYSHVEEVRYHKHCSSSNGAKNDQPEICRDYMGLQVFC